MLQLGSLKASGDGETMEDNITQQYAVGRTDDDANEHTHSRRALLASMGAGAAGLALGGLTETASASTVNNAMVWFVYVEPRPVQLYASKSDASWRSASASALETSRRKARRLRTGRKTS